MTTIQRINYMNMHFVENNKIGSQHLKKECAMKIQLKDQGVKKDIEMLNANNNLF